MTLGEYLDWKGLTLSEFGKRVGCTGMAVCRYRDGSRMPRPDTVAKIESATGRQVTYADLARTYCRAQAKLARARAA